MQHVLNMEQKNFLIWKLVCTKCKADCDLCSGAVSNSHKAVQCDNYEKWRHNACVIPMRYNKPLYWFTS